MIPHRVGRAWRGGFFYPRLLLAAMLGATGLLLGFSAVNVGGALAPRPSNPKLARWVVDHTANGQQAEFLVVLADQADLTDAKSTKSKPEKGRRVRDALWNKAQQTQQPILEWLGKHNIEFRPFYIVNAIWVKADAATAAALASRSDVLRVEGNPKVRNAIDPVPAAVAQASPDVIDTIETGISYSHAPQVWSLGYTGQGIVVAGADTGYRWTHTALKNHYRGWDGVTANHDYNWHDSVHSAGGATCGHDSTVPCDDTDHGTHTMGTAVGSDGGNNQIGMASGARWIGCRNMDRGTGTPARYIECMEFFLAPYPVGGTTAQGNPDLAPDVSTNSWGCPTSEGCSPDTLQAAVEAQRAAGIFMVAAAGNDGANGCHSIADPPAIYDALYTIGALNNGTDSIASFSSRGSVTVDNSSRRKPDLSAPGTSVRSSVATTNTSYATFQGTSMATPHVAGAVALLWSADPALRNNIETTEMILNASAAPISSVDCSSTGVPNNTYGYGRLDAKAAVDAALLTAATRTAISRAANPATVTFYAGQNRTYRLERKSDLLNGPDWSPIAGVNDLTVTVNGPAQLSDPSPGNSQFYRVRLVDYGAR